MSRKKSIGLYHRAWEVIPGGVNSPVRAFKAVGVPPTFIERAKGSKIFDVDGNSKLVSAFRVTCPVSTLC